MTGGAAVDMYLYTAQGQGGAGVSATATTALADGDTISDSALVVNLFNDASKTLLAALPPSGPELQTTGT